MTVIFAMNGAPLRCDGSPVLSEVAAHQLERGDVSSAIRDAHEIAEIVAGVAEDALVSCGQQVVPRSCRERAWPRHLRAMVVVPRVSGLHAVARTQREVECVPRHSVPPGEVDGLSRCEPSLLITNQGGQANDDGAEERISN